MVVRRISVSIRNNPKTVALTQILVYVLPKL